MRNFNFFLCLTSFALVIQEQIIYSKCNEEDPNYIELRKLPASFSNDKLPNPNQETNRCFEHLGCLQTIPIHDEPQDPVAIETIFQISSRTFKSDRIPYKSSIICLNKSKKHCGKYPFNLNLLLNSKFNPKLRTIVATPGYKSLIDSKWQLDFRDRWLKLENVNVILVSWEGGNQGLYEKAVANTKIVARQLTVLLYYLASLNGFELRDTKFLNKFNLVGHSLGAHISGFTGKDLSGEVGRIIGLDPAGPEFYHATQKFRLDRSDAQLVMVIHSNGCTLSIVERCYGLEKPIGHLDYYANNGKHQPQCEFDSLGCSHRASIDYYGSFLDHEIYTREFLGDKYLSLYRLFAIPGNDYDDFHQGYSLSRLCPITTLDDEDLYSKDISRCTVPIDLVTRFDILQKELKEVYKIDLRPEMKTEHTYYFYTSPAFPYINNQNLIKIRIAKSDNKRIETTKQQLQKASDNQGKDDVQGLCDFELKINMASGAWLNTQVKNYKLLDVGDHYEIIVPYISTDSASKYELAKLDANDFYVNETDTDFVRLRSGIRVAFPKSIEVKGFATDRKESLNKSGGILGLIKNFFTMISDGDDGSNDVGKFHDCNLAVESITVQPLKKIHRHFVASYSINAFDKNDPELIILDDTEKSPKADLFHGKIEPNAKIDVSRKKNEIFIDTVILGPRDNTTRFLINDDDAADESEKPTIERSQNLNWLWYSLATLSLFTTLSVVTMIFVKKRKNLRNIKPDKIFLIED